MNKKFKEENLVLKDTIELFSVGLESTELLPTESRFFESYAPHTPFGWTVFKRNVTNHAEDLIKLIRQTQTFASTEPMVVSVDQEGGRVSRLPFVTDLGPPLHLSPHHIKNYGATLGHELKDLGIHLNFAPVCDVVKDLPANPAIGDRIFSQDYDKAARHCQRFLKGLTPFVEGCLKHFPGQGRATQDTHLTSTAVDASLADLLQTDLTPFVECMPAVSFVMLSHCLYPQVDPQYPASLSSTWIQEILVQRLSFEGIIVSDDMRMEAIDQQAFGAAMIQSLKAGCELMLICRDLDYVERAVQAVNKERLQDPKFDKLIQEKIAKLNQFRRHKKLV